MDSAVIGSIVAGCAAVVGPALVYRMNRRTATTDAAQRQIDQIQEDRTADRSQFKDTVEKLEARQQRVEDRLERSESLMRIASDYVLTLRWHISEGRPPPPPPFPPELTTGLGADR
jgi:hypothetical protein